MAKAMSSWSSHEIEIVEIVSVTLIEVELKLSSGALKVHLEFSQCWRLRQTQTLHGIHVTLS